MFHMYGFLSHHFTNTRQSLMTPTSGISIIPSDTNLISLLPHLLAVHFQLSDHDGLLHSREGR